MVKRKAKYVPSVQVRSDDLVIVDDEGNEHRPHEGEWVRFRKDVPIFITELTERASHLQEIAEEAGEQVVTPELATEYAEVSRGIIRALKRQIRDWTWTDEDWQPLPKPKDRGAFERCLWELADFELAWLQQNLSAGAQVSKN